ncbi:MAG: hypothetical protein ACLU99_08580 [Alphaproteobacteria bacterium]
MRKILWLWCCLTVSEAQASFAFSPEWLAVGIISPKAAVMKVR